MSGCVFCFPEPERTIYKSFLTRILWDGFPVSPGHALVVPKRHFEGIRLASFAERNELIALIPVAMRLIEDAGHRADGFNIGINDGLHAGQSIFHLHIHIIPRYRGDVPGSPRGGVRGVIPGKADY